MPNHIYLKTTEWSTIEAANPDVLIMTYINADGRDKCRVAKETGIKQIKVKYPLYDQFPFDCSRFEPQSFQDEFIPVPVGALQIF